MALPLHVSYSEVQRFLLATGFGGVLVYCVGNAFNLRNDTPTELTSELHQVFRLLEAAQTNGKVALFQKRSGLDGNIMYLAVRTRPGTHDFIERTSHGKH